VFIAETSIELTVAVWGIFFFIIIRLLAVELINEVHIHQSGRRQNSEPVWGSLTLNWGPNQHGMTRIRDLSVSRSE
jgi:hypothetical protein